MKRQRADDSRIRAEAAERERKAIRAAQMRIARARVAAKAPKCRTCGCELTVVRADRLCSRCRAAARPTWREVTVKLREAGT